MGWTFVQWDQTEARSGRGSHLSKYGAMRYLAVIQDHGDPAKIRRRELIAARELQAGDQLFVDEQPLRVWAVIDAPTKAGHDAIVICAT